MDKAIPLMTEEEQRDFWIETKDIVWYEYGKICSYGVVKYYLGLNMICPVDDLQPIVQMKGIKPGHDMKFISKNYSGMAGKRLSDVFSAILHPTRFEEFFKKFDPSKNRGSN